MHIIPHAKGLFWGFMQDVVLSVAASVFAFLLLRGVTEPIVGFTVTLLRWGGLALGASVVSFLFSNFYRRDRSIITIESVLHLLGAILVKEIILLALILFGIVPVKAPIDAVVLMFSDVVFTLLLCQFVHITRGTGVKDVRQLSAAKTALVVGTDNEAIALANDLNTSGSFQVVGLISQDEWMDGHILANYPVYYTENPDSIERLRWKLGGIDCIFFTRHSHRAQEDRAKIQPGAPLGKAELFVKRASGLLLSAVLLVFFSPLIAICALLIKLEDGGPVFYCQERLGKGGRIFKLVKFRSMRTDAESMGVPALCSGEDDPRLTRVGRFLRAHHLDELPQLWNVFVGDMCFVGWRPERAYFVNKIMERDERFKYLLQISPGVTSFATLYNGYTDTLEKMITRLDQDIYYLRSRSLWFDAKVLFMTFVSIVSGKKF